MKDIDGLKKALPEMMKLSEIEPELAKIRDERKAISNDLDIVKKLIDDREGKIQDVRQQSNAHKAQKTEVRERADVFGIKVDDANEKMRKAYQTKDQMRESYFKQLYEFELQNDKVRYIKGLANQQKRIKANKNEREDRITNKRQELENRPNPYMKEIETCDHLLQYCHKLKVQQGLVPATSEEVAKTTQKEMVSEYNRQDLEQKLKDGKIQVAVKQNDNMIVIGGGKGKKGKKPKAQAKPAGESKSFNVDFAVINKFGLVQVSPPLEPAQLDNKLQELADTKKRFETKGQEELDAEKSNIEKNIERMVDEDIQADVQAAIAQEEGDEEEKTKEVEKKPAARGGIRKPKDAFFDSDSDGEGQSQAYSKPSRGGATVNQRGGRRGGRGGKLQINEEEFPTL